MVDYVFKPYDPKFPKLFQKERERLQEFLQGEYQLEHFGSTAIPGLGGKGIIDIYLIVAKNLLTQVFENVENADYEARPASSKPERFVYVREVYENGEKERYHLHVSFPESFEPKKDLAFRDYLLTHPEAVEAYTEIKKIAAEKAHGSKEIYMQTKTPVIQEILQKAL